MLVFRRKVSSHCAVPVKPRPHLARYDGASVLNLYYHVKPQPCYTKPHSDWVKHFPTLDNACVKQIVPRQYLVNAASNKLCRVTASLMPRHTASNLRVSTSAVSITLGSAGNQQWGLDAGQHHRRWNVMILLALFNRSLTYVNDSVASYSAVTLIPHLQMSYAKLKLLRC
ncbi:hypothetical protein EV702DRAFT_1131848 [Suillus placidus]|uniref:Uncharacterized protein n=1 Tax=Suillus placidus TaxID=48579 RepID=A0A9P7CZ44_9AGAM|nr:hypothetical protein EV702DRAFT_1131848 [Suillus placidus]